MLPKSSPFDDIETDRPQSFDLFGRPERTWRVIYAAPRWRFDHYANEQDAKANSYEAMSTLPVSSIADKDAVLFLWCPDTMTDKGLNLIRAWGFKYRGAAFHWAKTRDGTNLSSMDHHRDLPMSTGYITRGNMEPLLLATRGEPPLRKHLIDNVMRTRGDIRKLQFFPRCKDRGHPEEFMALIEQLYDGPYLSLYEARKREGWGSWAPRIATPSKTEDLHNQTDRLI